MHATRRTLSKLPSPRRTAPPSRFAQTEQALTDVVASFANSYVWMAAMTGAMGLVVACTAGVGPRVIAWRVAQLEREEKGKQQADPDPARAQ